jgi:hypothetical protein
MVILLSDLPDEIEQSSLRKLVEQYYPVNTVEPCGPDCGGRPVEWKIELGDADREVANFVTDKINGSYWQGWQVNAYCPLFQ